MHPVGEALGGSHMCGKAGKAEEEGVGTLVAEQKRQQLLLIVDHAGRQEVGGVLAKEMMGDKCGHGGPFGADEARMPWPFS